MMMEPFYNRFPEIAEKETRCMVIRNEEDDIPNGKYFLLESYCNNPKCDCRRVFINILHENRILATIGYGWENPEFYEKWMGEKDFAKDLKGPILEITGEHTEHAGNLLRLFEDMVLTDNDYVDTLKRHYKMFKPPSLKKKQIKEDVEELKDFAPDLHTIASLCKENGSGFDCITDDVKEAFLPIIVAVEEIIWNHYSEDCSLKDSEVIESLKHIRDNLFSENAKFNELEKNILDRLKAVLFLNKYSKRDVSLSISCVLKSAKLHKSVSGSRGYLTFISSFFDQMRK